MTETTLRDRCKINTNYNSDTFVGINVTKDDISVNFPLGFRLSDDEKQLRKDILLLLNVLSRNTDVKMSELDLAEEKRSSAMPIYSYLYVISDFYSRGYYKETETVNITSRRGKINWSKTIKTQRPYCNNDGTYYLNFVTRKKSYNENELITRIHEYCVYLSFEYMGWLFTAYKPEQPKTKWNGKLFTSAVKRKLSETYNDRNRHLFRSMLSIIESVGDDEAPKEYRYGTNDFEYIWETMIDKAYGASEKSNYFPSTRWIMEDGEYENSYLRPDVIMIRGETIYVLDAKFYKFGTTGKAMDLPQSGDINKQITYGEYIAENNGFRDINGNSPTVYNAFIMPYDSFGNVFNTGRRLHYAGKAVSDWKSSDGVNTYEQIAGILLDIRSLMQDYSSHNNDRINELADLIENRITQ